MCLPKKPLLLKLYREIYRQHRLKYFPYRQSINISVTFSVQLHWHWPLKKRTIPRKAPSHLPPLSKGGGLTARHKPWFYCFLLAICPPFLCCKLFCRQDGGIASRCTEYCCLHNHCKRTTHPRSALNLPRQRWTSVARSSRANYSEDCSCLEVVSLIALVLVLSLFHIDKCIDSNSEPEKCYPAKRTIGS